MNRNLLFGLACLVIIVVAVVGYIIYEDQHTSGIDVKVGNGGLSVQTK